jgi:hypothetical protein
MKRQTAGYSNLARLCSTGNSRSENNPPGALIKKNTDKRENGYSNPDMIAGSLTCSTKEMSIHLTKILSAVKEGQQKYCETVYSRSGINHMWILKNSTIQIG